MEIWRLFFCRSGFRSDRRFCACISAGIFVGSIAVALAEILNTFPITFRRMGLKVGLFWVMLAMAAGKVAGSLYYFLGNFKAQ